MTKVLYFSAPWCAPCKIMRPMVEELQKELEEVEWEKINIDDTPAIAQAHDVMSIPTFLVFNGKRSKRITGAVGKKTLVEAITVWE